jgi:hypothetical protein
LIGLGIPEDEAHYYEDEFKAGRLVVTARAENRYEEAAQVLRRHGGYDMANRDVGPTTATEDITRGHPR